MQNTMPNKNSIVFCIWLGSKMPDKYIYRVNTVFTELYSSNSNLVFMLYTDNPNSIIKQFTTDFDMLCMLKKIQIKSTETLFSKYDDLIATAIKQYRQNDLTYLTTDKYFIQYPKCKLPERTHHNAWALLHTSAMYFLYIKKIYNARVALNLRLIALALHGGLYFDVDVMSHSAVKFYNFDKSVNEYVQCKKDIRKFILARQTFNDFMKFVKKISQKYGIEVADYSNDNMMFLDKLKNICISRITSAITDYNIYDKNDKKSTDFNELPSGFYAISNYITKANANGAFSQNVLYVNTIDGQREIEEATIYSLVFNMKLASREPNSWNLMKVNGGYEIVASRIDNKFQMPFDVFLSRNKYPLLIKKTECDIEIAYRTGRPLHPIGQIATRGCWNFLVNKFSKFPYINSYINSSSTTPLATFHVSIYNTVLYPESAVIDSKSIGVHSSEHWTKVKNKKDNYF